MSEVAWQIPSSVLRHLDTVPRDRPVALLLRHSVREDLPAGEAGRILPITPSGRALATQLGELLRGRLKSLHASPLTRCMQTAEAVRLGSGLADSVVPDRLLGNPGAYVIDEVQGGLTWEHLGHERVMAHLVSERTALPGLARPDEAARFLVQHLLTTSGGEPGIHVFVTHDSVITATAARTLGSQLGPDAWPWYLEAAFFWRSPQGVHAAYRGHAAVCARRDLCSLDVDDVVEFARREIAATVGLESGARFFLAGGAFKTLLTGRAPRDLDIWAPSERDRELLLSAIESRGALQLEPSTFADRFRIADRIVEVPRKVVPPTLEERLDRFDIALSAIGVEHRPHEEWRACVHALALESARRREVLLLKPLMNAQYARLSLNRVHRYARELGFSIPESVKAEIRGIIDQQQPQ